jgi:hypothetical protein
MAVESEEILSKISDLIESKVDELSTNLNNFRQEASNNNQTLENAIGSIKSVIDEKLSKIDQISSEINSIQTSVQSVADNVSVTNNKIDNILSQQNQLQRTVDSVSQKIEKLSTVTSNQLTYLSNQSQNITEKIDKLSLQQERESRTEAVEGARGTVVVDPTTGKTVSGVAAADATGDSEETKQSLIGSVLSGIKGILTSPLALGGAALGAAALGTAYALRKEPPGTPQAGSDAELNIPRDTSGSRRTGGQTDQGPSLSPSGTTPSSGEYSGSLARDRKAAFEKELENPAVIRRLYNLSRTEVGKNPINQQLFSETVFNRSMFTGRSLSSTMSSVRSEGVRGGYYPVIKNYNPSPEELERFKQSVINKTISGANNTSMATDNASLDVARRRMQAGAHGQYLGVGKKDITKEYYYSGGKGAGRYRTKHGIRAQEYQRRIEQERQQQQSRQETAPHPDARREPPQRQETSGYEIPDNVSFSSQSVERRASNLNEETKQSLENFKRLAPQGAVVTSTYRSPRHSIERRKRRPGAHTRGQAIDIRTRGVSKEDLQKTIQGLKRSGFNYILLEGNPPHIHAERRPGQKGFMIRNLGRGNPHISLNNAREAADQVELNDAQRQPNAEKQQKQQEQTQQQSFAGNTPESEKEKVNGRPDQQQGYKEERSGSILSYFGINPAYGDDTRLSAEEVERRNKKFAKEQYQKSLQQFESSVGKDSLGDDTGTVYDPTSSEIPKYQNMRRAIGMPGDKDGKDIEGMIEKEQPLKPSALGKIEKKQPLLDFRGILRDPSDFGRMLGYERYVDKNRMKKLMEQSKMLQSMDDADLNLTPPKTKDEMNKTKDEMNEILDKILKMAKEAKEKSQEQRQSQPVAGSLAGPGFYSDISHPPGQNGDPKRGTGSAQRPKHKIKLNQYIDPDTVIGEI